MTDTTELTQTLIQKIIDGDNVSAKDDFEAIIGAKLSDTLEIRKQAIAQAIYDKPEFQDDQGPAVDQQASV